MAGRTEEEICEEKKKKRAQTGTLEEPRLNSAVCNGFIRWQRFRGIIVAL